MYYVIIDTNVLVSALLTKKADAATVQIVEKIFDGIIVPLYSLDIMKEYQEVLHRQKFHFSEKYITGLLNSIEQYGIMVNPTSTDEILPDEKDIIFYEVVMEKREDNAYLVTGNIKHFPQREYIVTPAEMLRIIDEKKTEKRLA